jgi:hypothetical protein
MTDKKAIRAAFRMACFERDGYRCAVCGCRSKLLDAHHIIDRHDLPAGGYVPENGITLCSGDDEDNCHWKAERWHATGSAPLGYDPQSLFERIGSNLDLALSASERLAWHVGDPA